MNRWIHLVAGIGIGAAALAEPAPDLVLLHGRIHTQDPARRVVEALAIRGNAIVATGPDVEIGALAGPATRSVDLHGRLVIPGIIDAHTHPVEGAQDLGKCNLGDVTVTPADVAGQVAKCIAADPGDPNSWFTVVQVSPSGLTLTRADLDGILERRPLVLYGSDGHTAWANSAALAAAHIDRRTKDPVGGRIERDSEGEPTGTLRDAAADHLSAVVPRASIEVESEQLLRALAGMRATGITSVQDASVDEHIMQVYKRLYDQHRLDMRVRASFTLKNLRRPARALVSEAVSFRARWNVDADFLRADAVKIFADGVIEYPSQTAALLEPYLDGKGKATHNRGPSYFTPANLGRIVAAADAAGFTVHIHAIGDRAVRGALDAFARSRRLNGRGDNRDQIAHLELIDPRDVPRFKALDVMANVQLLWAMDDDYVEKATIPYLGRVRAQHLYLARSLRDAGATLVGGSDWDVSSYNPFEAMERAVTRAKGRGEPALVASESITVADAVDAYTINAARALRQETTTGSLVPGKRADLVILDRDIFSIDPYELHATRVEATYLDGREIYSGAPL